MQIDQTELLAELGLEVAVSDEEEVEEEEEEESSSSGEKAVANGAETSSRDGDASAKQPSTTRPQT